MKYIFSLFFCIACSSVFGQELMPIKKILDEGIASNDNPKIAYVLKRCITLNSVMARWLKEKGGQDMQQTVENFTKQIVVLRDVSFKLENEIERDRKIKISSAKELDAILIQNIKDISPHYIDRLSKNYVTSGSYFENDAQLKEEITICADFFKYINNNY
jgi:hypothetical protein